VKSLKNLKKVNTKIIICIFLFKLVIVLNSMIIIVKMKGIGADFDSEGSLGEA